MPGWRPWPLCGSHCVDLGRNFRGVRAGRTEIIPFEPAPADTGEGKSIGAQRASLGRRHPLLFIVRFVANSSVAMVCYVNNSPQETADAQTLTQLLTSLALA